MKWTSASTLLRPAVAIASSIACRIGSVEFDQHETIRRHVVEVINKDLASFAPFVVLNDGGNIQDYVADMGRIGTYADNVAVVAAVRAYGQPIIVYKIDHGGKLGQYFYDDNGRAKGLPLRMYLHREHYEILVPKSDSGGVKVHTKLPTMGSGWTKVQKNASTH